MQIKHSNPCKLVALLLFVCIMATLLLSTSFIIFNTDHICAGDGCKTCEQLETCTNTIKKLSISLYAFLFTAFAYAALLLYTILSLNYDKKENTLVRLKVRLDI